MAGGRPELPTDVVVEILLRLPPIPRRRVRLVCRLWRNVVDKHTTEMQSRATALLWDTMDAVAYVVDDLSKSSTGSYTELWRRDTAAPYTRPSRLQLIGTCNGLLCLCDNEEFPGGAVTLVNPATGEALPVPPLPCAGPFRPRDPVWEKWHEAYSFGHHPTTGQYKVVHVPCTMLNDACRFDAVQVLTLGDASWREVPAGPAAEGACCNLDAGVVSVDGATYWVVQRAASRWVVSFDLDKEEVTRVRGCQEPYSPDHHQLTEVHGRLGIVVVRGLSRRTEVWVLEKGRRKWRCRYSLTRHDVPRPRFVYGECVLTLKNGLMYGHHRQKGVWSSSKKAVPVEVNHGARGTLLATMKGGWFRTFSYVQTTEPLSIYMLPIDNA
ncbi:hypothetical protein ZWY2020_012261 [Hordeum vulgare]|nr:hypothetical protein ZWY2020_012261 [Hordeum vulgare]